VAEVVQIMLVEPILKEQVELAVVEKAEIMGTVIIPESALTAMLEHQILVAGVAEEIILVVVKVEAVAQV
tara:strand:- start:285 stop:494 length:210 start_codon:yes stop_codon:yes gene_type:complete